MSEITTAAALNSFRSELYEGGYSPEQIGELATITLRALTCDGQPLIVRESVSA